MKALAQRLSFRGTKNLGVGALLAIFLGVIGFSYLTTEHALDGLNGLVGQLFSAQGTVLKVNDFLRGAQDNFIIYTRRDRISKGTVLERFDLLESRLREPESLALRGASDRGVDFSLVENARMAFFYYLDEELIDPAADTATAYLTQLERTLLLLREQLWEYVADSQGTPDAKSLEKEVTVIDRIIGATELDLRRYVDRERVTIEDIEIPIREAEELLNMPESVWAGLPSGTIAVHSELARALRRYRAALGQLVEEERVTGEAIYVDFEQKVNEAAAAAEVALLALNQMMSQNIQDQQSELIVLGQREKQGLLLLGLIGIFLAVGVSYVLSLALSARLLGLVEGARKISKGVRGYRLETGADDEVGVLARAFNEMMVQLEEKEASLERHISNVNSAHRAVKAAKEGLERQVFERTRELRDALDEARVANRTKDEFLAKVSHEVRTPLNGVLGMADVLNRSGLNEHQRSLVRSLEESGNSLLRIINDILDFSKIKSGHLELKKSLFDPVTTIESVVDLVSSSAYAKGLEFIYYLPIDFPRAMEGDQDRFRQILLNLLDNAVKFTDRGEISLHGTVERDGNFGGVLRIEVCDTGIGIPQQARGRIFEAFIQADASSTRRFAGTGLGLTICKQLVEAMDGEIGFSSRSSSGTRFWITLPFAERPHNVVQLSTDDLSGRRILVAESNPACRAVLSRLLAELGCVSDLVDGGRAALARLRATDPHAPYDAVIADVTLPDVKGLELAKDFNREVTNAPIPFILLTAPNPETGPECSSIRIAGSLRKPVRREVLWRVLRSAIDARVGTGVKQPVTEAPKAFQDLRVLVAEDNPVSQEVMRYLLEGLGCQVEVTSDGRQALAAFERTPFNIVLLDCQMPHVDGFQVAQQIRQREGAGKRTPLMALTASAMESDRQTCLAAGMDDYLTKPINEKMLFEILSRWCRSDPAR